MNEEEKEFEEKTKQYQYEQMELQKRLRQLEQDHIKGTKKSFIYKMNKFFGRIGTAYISIWIIGLILAVILALAFVLNGLKAFDPVIEIENKYDINLKQISRTAKNKVLTYKVKPTSGKYKKVGFLIIKKGREQAIDDFDDNCLKYIIENIVDKELLQNFEKEETTTEYGMLEYNLIYTGDDEAKLQQLRDYILKYDWNISKIIDLNNKIK